MTGTRKKAIGTIKIAEIIEDIKIAGIGKDSKENKGGENLRSNLAQVLCIQYLINLRKKSVSTLFDSGSKINAVYPTFAKELGLLIRPIDVEAQKN